MNRFVKVLKETALYIWQLPQNIVGLIFMLFLSPVKRIPANTIASVYSSDKMSGGISLGKYALLSKVSSENVLSVRHEGIGHALQSRYLGPLYLVVIGIPSVIWASLYRCTGKSYYWFYTERWADKLADINR